MEAENFLASGLGTRLAIESKAEGWTRLGDVARILQPSRLKGFQVSPESGRPSSPQPKSKPAIRIGYLQAVPRHPLLGRPRVLKGAFGSSVPELSPDDVSGISVPRLPTAIEDKIADMMEEAATLRTQADELEKQIADEAEGHLNQFLSTA